MYTKLISKDRQKTCLGLGIALMLFAFNQAQAKSSEPDHAKDHGGQIYQSTTVESKWVMADAEQSVLESEWETWLGTDENKLFLKIHSQKAESAKHALDVLALYSRNVSEFWDVQGGVRYRHDENRLTDQSHVDGVVGLYGTMPYLIDTQAYVYMGQDRFTAFSIEMARDFLLTQKWITQPHLAVDVVMRDDSRYAQKNGLSNVELGLETRYEITPTQMPFMDISYRYDRGGAQTQWQHQDDSNGDWHYAVGLRFMF